MGAVETAYEEVPNIFDTGGAKGLPGHFVEKIAKAVISNDNNVDDTGERVSCSVCLQVNYVLTTFICYFFLSVCIILIDCVVITDVSRTFNWRKLSDVCHNVITCFTYRA